MNDPKNPDNKLPLSDRGVRDNRSEEQSTDDNLTDVDPKLHQRLPGSESKLPASEERLPGREERLPGYDQNDVK